jgi:hypothetical protein
VDGDRRQLFVEAAARVHQQPDGRLVKLSARTVEAWCVARAVPHGIPEAAAGEASPGAERMG